MKKALLYFYFLFFFFCSTNIFSKQTKSDSLRVVLNNTSTDSVKVQLLHQLYLATDSIEYSLKGLELAENIEYKKGIALLSLDIGRFYYFSGKEDKSLSYLINCSKTAEKLKDKKILISVYRYLGFVYRPRDPYMAQNFYEKSLKLSEETNDELSASYAFSALGNIYEGIFEGASENNKKALNYYLKSLEIRERKGSLEEIAASLNETSRVYNLLGQFDKGLELRVRGLDIAEKSGSKENIIYLCNVLGNDYGLRLGDYKKGLSYQLKAYTIGLTQKNNYETMFDISKGVAYSYFFLGDLKNSNHFFQQAMIYHDSVRAKSERFDYNISGTKHDLETQLEQQKQLLKLSEILKEKAKTEKQTTLRNASLIAFILILALFIVVIRNNRQKQKINKELFKQNNKLEEAYKTLEVSERNFKQITETINDVFYLYNIVERRYEYISPNCMSMLGLDPQKIYNGQSMKAMVHKEDLQKVIDANVKVDSGNGYDIEYRIVVDDVIKWVAEKSSPIFDNAGKLVRNSGILRDITLRKSNEEKIRIKTKSITDSIIYAKTIQDALLVPKTEIAKSLSRFFVLSKPKEIVSGDFYFYKETKDHIYVSVADCTGHGVPAGFMSMLGNAFIYEIVNNNDSISPSKILDHLNKMIIGSLNQNKSDSESKDGMDIAILCFEKNLKSVQYSGASNPFYIIRNGELIEVAPDVMSIGINVDHNLIPFTNHKIELQKNDMLYIFSDGYTDQFGGPEGKRFTRKRMQKLILSIHDKTMNEQEKLLDTTFDEWKGTTDQVDDVMVFGIKV